MKAKYKKLLKAELVKLVSKNRLESMMKQLDFTKKGKDTEAKVGRIIAKYSKSKLIDALIEDEELTRFRSMFITIITLIILIQ